MRYAEDHKERMYERLLMEASAVIRSDGPEKLSVATLMDRVGLTHGGFYVYFKSKDDLIEKALDYMFVQRAKYVAQLSHDDPKVALTRLVDSYVSPKMISAGEDACPIPLLAGEHHRLPGAARERFTVGVDRLTSSISDLIARAEIDIPPDEVDSVVAELIGAASLARVKATDEIARRFLAATRRSIVQKLRLE